MPATATRLAVLVLVSVLLVGCIGNRRCVQSAPGPCFGGVYRSPNESDDDEPYWGYLRFYPDRTVVTCSSTGTPEDLGPWFQKDFIEARNLSHGTYTLTGGQIEFTSTSKEGAVDYRGRVRAGELILDSHSRINGHRATTVYRFHRQ